MLPAVLPLPAEKVDDVTGGEALSCRWKHLQSYNPFVQGDSLRDLRLRHSRAPMAATGALEVQDNARSCCQRSPQGTADVPAPQVCRHATDW